VLARAGLQPRDLDAVFFSTVTGAASPSIDRAPGQPPRLRPDVKERRRGDRAPAARFAAAETSAPRC